MTRTVHLVPVLVGDEPFLRALFCSTREPELAALGDDPALGDAFLGQQWDAQRCAFVAQYPGAEHSIVMVDGRPAGRLVVDRAIGAITVVDMALLPLFRNRGIGTGLVKTLQAQSAAAATPIRLHVLRSSPARRFYQRLGFRAAGEAGLHLVMEWRAT